MIHQLSWTWSTSSTVDRRYSYDFWVKCHGWNPLNFPWFLIKTQYQKASSFFRRVPDAGLLVPATQKPVTRRWGKQKAPKKPCTPRKKKGVAAQVVAKKPSLLAKRRTSFRQEPSLQQKMTEHYIAAGGNLCFMSFFFSFQTSKGCSLVHLKQFLRGIW
jgi:hypothetical protein